MSEPERKASFLYSLKAVFWSFFGLRRKRDFDTDSASINPVHVVIAALIGVVIIGSTQIVGTSLVAVFTAVSTALLGAI